MKIYAVTYLFAGDESPSTYYTAESCAKLVNTLLDEWVAGDLELRGTMKFLRDHGAEPPMEDESVMEGEFEEEIVIAAEMVRALLVGEGAGADAVAAEYLAAVASSVRVEEKEDVEIPDNIRAYVTCFLRSGAFGGVSAGLSQKGAEAWLAEPGNRLLIMDALRGWSAADIACMDEDDLGEILLEGLPWVALMEALRAGSS